MAQLAHCSRTAQAAQTLRASLTCARAWLPMVKKARGSMPAQVNEARKVCAACAVREQCASWAIETGERNGVWGGMSQQELRTKRRRFTSRARTNTRAAS
jgi:hypothetical protein